MAGSGSVAEVTPRDLIDAVRQVCRRVDWHARRFAPETPEGVKFRQQCAAATIETALLMARFDVADVRLDEFPGVRDRADLLVLLRLKVDLEIVRTGHRPDPKLLDQVEKLLPGFGDVG